MTKTENSFPRKRHTIKKELGPMKNLIWAIVILAVAAALLLEFRYALVVNSPVVARIDRLTGEVWIVNSGVWRKIQPPS